ncbi:hypothetical protein [Herbiconiux sp. UC225_62]|uniref:hypothetical protein n=1 Tax=Herbiconiux sp. UC225_62 TaxID=3350168 RepID=UPI0036D2CC63
MFGKMKTWQKATGTVLARTIAGTDSDGAMITYDYAVEVHPVDGAAFRAMLKDPRMLTDFLQPIVGKTIGVEFDAASGKARFDKSDPQLSFKAFERAQQDAVRRALDPRQDS